MVHAAKDLKYQIIGEDSSPKLVFLHGIMGQGRNWLSIAKKFSKKYQCLIFDQRGHGHSFHPESGFTVADFADDLLELLDHLGWTDPIHLVGHSMGGRVALVFTDRHSERVAALTIVDIGPSSDWATMQGILDKLAFVPVPFLSRVEARKFMENDFLAKYPSKMLMEFFYSNLAERDGQWDWLFSARLVRQTLEQSRYRDYWAEFKNLSGPSLLIRGEKSEDLKAEDFAKVLSQNPKIQGVTVPGAGHWVHAEKPLETLRIIDDFFNIAAQPKQ